MRLFLLALEWLHAVSLVFIVPAPFTLVPLRSVPAV